MGWFDEKIITSFSDDRKLAEEAIGDILKYYHVRIREIPDKLKDINEVLEYLLCPAGIMRRTVKLSGDWYQDAIGAMLGTKKDGSIIALLPGGMHGYYYREYSTGKIKKINRKNAGLYDDTCCNRRVNGTWSCNSENQSLSVWESVGVWKQTASYGGCPDPFLCDACRKFYYSYKGYFEYKHFHEDEFGSRERSYDAGVVSSG